MQSKSLLLSKLSTAEHRLLTFITFCTLAICAGTYVLRNRALISEGGSAFLHGEWLINYGAGFVRRGASGSFAITASDVTGLSPLLIVEGLQSGMVLLLIAAVLISLWKVGAPTLVLILCLSPAFLLFWLNNYGVPLKDIHGKEMLGFVTLLPLLHAAASRRFMPFDLLISGLIYVVAVLFYEPNLLFVVPLLMATYIAQREHAPPGTLRLYSAVLLGIAGFLALVTVSFPDIVDVTDMCTAVTERGVDAAICSKFNWNTETLQHAMNFTSSRTEMRSMPRNFMAVILAFLPIVLLFLKLQQDRALYLAIVLQAAAFVPLYFLGIDYGRWLNIQVASITLLILMALLAGRLADLQTPSNRFVIWPLLLLCYLWGLQPIFGGVELGAVKYVVATFTAP